MTVIIDTLAATGKVAAAVGSIAKSSPMIQRHLQRTLYRFRHGALQIPVFGSGGVGKSTAARVLAGAKPDAVAGAYHESMYLEKVALEGNIPGSFLVAPGQLNRVQRYWPHAFNVLARGKAVGLINIVSYGHHSLDLETFEGSDAYHEGMSVEEFLGAYTAQRRQVEIDLLNALVDGLSATTSSIWLATLVNKRDLWSKDEAAVMDYYAGGAYQAQIDRIQGRLGTGAFQHEIIPTCFTISNLVTRSGQVLAPVTEGFDVAARNRTLEEMTRRIRELLER